MAQTTFPSPVRPAANDYVTVYESPDPQNVYAYSPAVIALPSGRLVLTMDIGGKGVADLPGPKGSRNGYIAQGKIYVSDDKGRTWTHTHDFPFLHARPFVAGGKLYVIGHCVQIMIIRSEDGGQTWSEPSRLTSEGDWHQAPCNVHYANGSVYLVMENIRENDLTVWPVSQMEPVLMRARVDSDMTDPVSWTFASRLSAIEAFPSERLDYFGVPFFTETPYYEKGQLHCALVGWLETNVVQFTDPDHYWHDPAGKTFHLWARAHTGGTGYAAIAKVVEHEDGSMTTKLETTPSGKKAVFVPCPGGQMKFHILYDEQTKLYWLLSSQSTDSMTRKERLPAERFDLPNNERHRLQLHFSKNCVDWCFAALVAAGASPRQSRHYASMAIDGDDLHVASRSGDVRARDAHNGNLITFHTVRNFRSLVY
ncbi:sialidase family protein [Paenibacillus oceani]|uniref:Exo-alpha-sialidase n=1 Tax=Paenibacillus oceani TaxID=2772510 RepID=A0A927H3Z2_9BACL|nr:sialidase family protein [Paenibacillus oceani]MBD2865999.1 exo-alpha-sialidase [Paenibacillus oceani]